MSTETVILLLVGALQTVGLGVAAYVAAKVVSLSEQVARLTQASEGAEAHALEQRTRVAEIEARLTAIEIEQSRLKALVESVGA